MRATVEEKYVDERRRKLSRERQRGSECIATEPSRPVLLLAYDCPYPDPLRAVRPILDAFAVGMVLAADGAGPRVQASLEPGTPEAMEDEGLERIRRGIPAARLLPLLVAIAIEYSGQAVAAHGALLATDARVPCADRNSIV